MDQPLPDTSPAPPSVPQGRTRRARWTPALQASFLGTLLQTGCVRHAARSVGLLPSSAHRLRRRLAGTDFDRNWDEALMLHDQWMARPLALHHDAGTGPAAVGREVSEAHK